jgi:hypothetical protein
MPCKEFRFQRGGLGATKDKKMTVSREMGEAFCRWFLTQHAEIVWLATIDEVRGHGAILRSGGYKVESDNSVTGDAPDYFCVSSKNAVGLAEAKGTLNAVGFSTKLWQTWRQQFDRVRVIDPKGTALKVKGYIVATRWATEDDSPKVCTKLLAEDPETRGERPFVDEGLNFAAAVKSINYVSILNRLRLPVFAAALSDGSTIPSEWRFQVSVWECLLPKLKGMRFVGGAYGSHYWPYYEEFGDEIIFRGPHPYRLDVGYGTFVGIEENVFQKLVAAARNGPLTINELRPLDDIRGSTGGSSLLRDGKMLGPIELFRPIANITV